MIFENLDLFTRGEFGQPALINGQKVYGIFDEYFEPSFNQIATEGRKFSFLVQSSQVAEIEHGFSVEIVDISRTFEVISTEPLKDGKLTNLILEER